MTDHREGGLLIGPAFCVKLEAMVRSILVVAAVALFTGLSGCSSGDGIDPDGEVYHGVGAETAITVLGTEPFWGLDIGAEANGAHAARYTTPDNMDGAAFALARFSGNNGLGFSGELEGKPVQVAITPGECSDGMSDRTYPFAATVMLGDDTLFGCAYTDETPFSGPQNP
ncbi:MAG: hypothetical protein AAFR32_07715 [Pseudomonadota bacterium]